MEDNRVDSILMQASSLSVRDELEEVGGFNCYVIDAATDYGPYTVWIDPQHGYNIARAENTKKPESLVRDGKRRFGGHGSYHFLLDNVHFEKIDGIWVPMEAYIEVKRYNADGRLRRTWKMHHKRTDFQLNPDHHALGSFIPQIEEGSRFPIEGVPGIQYEWRDGEIVTYIDEFVIDALDKSVDSLCSDVNANLTLNDKGKNEKTPDSAVLKVEKQPDEQDKDSAQDQVVATPGPGFSILFLLIGIGLAFLVVLFVVYFRRGKGIPHEKT
jgi:hypothetical protein